MGPFSGAAVDQSGCFLRRTLAVAVIVLSADGHRGTIIRGTKKPAERLALGRGSGDGFSRRISPSTSITPLSCAKRFVFRPLRSASFAIS